MTRRRATECIDSPRGPTLAIAVAALALACGCRGNATREETPTPASPPAQRPVAYSDPVPEDPVAARFQRTDLLVAQWDAAQAEGRTAQADEVFQRVRAEVDAGYADFEAAARGRHGVRMQYLGVVGLGFSSRRESTALLVETLNGSDARLIGNALIALKLRADPDTPLPPLLKLIPVSAPDPKRYAPLALANVLEARQQAGRPPDPTSERQALHLLSGVVADRDPYVRLHAAKALGFIRQPGSFELLLVLLRDEHNRIRVASAASLERLGDPRGFPEVIRLLAEIPEESKPVIRDVLASYAARLDGRPLDPAQVEALGISPLAWHRWFPELSTRKGIRLPADVPTVAQPTPGPVVAPPVVPPPAPFPTPSPTLPPPNVSPMHPPSSAPSARSGTVVPPPPPPPPPPTQR